MAKKNTHTYTADATAPPMLRYQASLPTLPVPPLASTLEKYIESVTPLLTPAQLAHTKSTAAAFLSSPLAAELQTRLEARAGTPGTANWLSDWWNDAAYMGYRDPVVVFVSYFFVHTPNRTFRDSPARAAAHLLKATLPFRALVESGQLEPEKARTSPLCMASYKWLFHAARFPTKPSDTAHKFEPKEHNHVVVLRRNRFFVVPLAHPSTGQELSAAELEVQFSRIIELAEEKGAPVGALTSDNRDRWTEAREALLKLPGNEEKVRAVDSAMIIVALDDSAPVTREETSWATWVGDGRNRWFDKHQPPPVIVYANGRSGFLGEHSCMDGTPTLRLNEFILASLAHNKVPLGPERTESTAADLPVPTELKFTLDAQLNTLIKDAEGRFDELVGKHDLHCHLMLMHAPYEQVLHYEAYGKNYIKTHKLSPDAWAQLTMQLAFHKLHSRLPAVYESAQTRKFQLGRTEVIRSASSESKAFVEAIASGKGLGLGKGGEAREVRALFEKAVKRHGTYAAWAADGRGVDRHLFGLKKLVREGEEVPELFKDEAFGKSSHWELSTSQLSSPYFDGWGYGEVVPDGYGLSYAIGDNYIRWTITSLKQRTEVLKHYLAEAATEIRDVLEAARKEDAEAIAIDSTGHITHSSSSSSPSARTLLDQTPANEITVLPKGTFLLPPFTDLHAHAPQFLYQGTGLHLPLMQWLDAYAFKAEERLDTDPALAQRVYHRLAERLSALGTGTVLLFGTINEDTNLILANAMHDAGLRAYVGKLSMDRSTRPTYVEPSTDAALASARSFVARCRALSGPGLVRPVLTPRFVPTCSDALLEGLAGIMQDEKQRSENIKLQSHMAEARDQVEWVRRERGVDDIDVFDRVGPLPRLLFKRRLTPVVVQTNLLTPHTIQAHCTFLFPSSLSLCATRGTAVAHCPLSNAYFSSEPFKLREALSAGVRVGLGSDVAGGYDLDIMCSMRWAVGVSRMREGATSESRPQGVEAEAPLAINWQESLYLATVGGLDALGLPARAMGTFDVGAPFDAQQIRLFEPESARGVGALDFFDLEIKVERGERLEELAEITLEMVEKWWCVGDGRNRVALWVQGRAVWPRI
ncbi:hypothetical protein DXG03_007466 [Asterophora parasitica]|uniref:Carnitine O-acetyltransferase, mitochondrial n=1 Tax=Asterophora parasitica TaxID=117018 RepID=A0A9P7G8M3_9AGAR|nr:hypothetical protein DXG03_007466 [Asterophora parasitica]